MATTQPLACNRGIPPGSMQLCMHASRARPLLYCLRELAACLGGAGLGSESSGEDTGACGHGEARSGGEAPTRGVAACGLRLIAARQDSRCSQAAESGSCNQQPSPQQQHRQLWPPQPTRLTLVLLLPAGLRSQLLLLSACRLMRSCPLLLLPCALSRVDRWWTGGWRYTL